MKGLSYLKYQKQRMVEFLNRNPNMKIIVEVDLTLKNTNNEEIRRRLSSVQCGFYKIYKKDHPCDMYHYKKYVNDSFIKWDNINFPVGNNEINQFEEQNKHISVNVYYINPNTNSKTILVHKEATTPKHSKRLL